MQIGVRSRKTYLLWSAYNVGRWFVIGVGFIAAGLLHRINLHLGLVLGGLFGIISVYQWRSVVAEASRHRWPE